MKVRIVEWLYYVPDCPADLEVTDDELLGILTIDDNVEARTQTLINAYRLDRIEEDFGESSAQRWWQYQEDNWDPNNPGPEYMWPRTNEEKMQEMEQRSEEAKRARADFDGFYNGYFNHREYELNQYTAPYGQRETTT